MHKIIKYDTDVRVIEGSLSELLSAIRARQQKASVIHVKKEYIETHLSDSKNPDYFPYTQQMDSKAHPNTGKFMDTEEDPPQFERKGLWLSAECEVQQERVPVSTLFTDGHTETFTDGTSLGITCHKTKRVVTRDNLSCATLFTTGDARENMAAGACYPVMEFAIMHARVTGSMRGINAAQYAKQANFGIIKEAHIQKIHQKIYTPRQRQGDFTPRWVNQVLKDTLMPYFILFIKSKERLQTTLTSILFIKGHILPFLKAHDAHELRLTLECRNMILCAEIKRRSSLIRTESRGTHYREDYPRRDHTSLAWTKIRGK